MSVDYQEQLSSAYEEEVPSTIAPQPPPPPQQQQQQPLPMLQSHTKIDHLLINFDYIDVRKNQIEVLTSDKNVIFYARILNRTDVFKGIKNGAIYLHSKTSIYLNLNNHSADLCLTSLTEPACSHGWTVSFWVKVSYLTLFDKTLLKVDNFQDNRVDDGSKFFLLRLSSFDMKVEFLYKRKLWSISQSIMWKSEWTMLTFTWSEFEGISVYVNSVRLLCQQTYEYYSINDLFSLVTKTNRPGGANSAENIKYNSDKILFKRSTGGNTTSGPLSSTIFIGINNKITRTSRRVYWNYASSDPLQSLTNGNNNNQNVSLTSAFSESILIDELAIINYQMNSKEITNIYLKG